VNRPELAPRDRWGPAAVVLVWLAGAALSRAVGMWAGVGGAALALGAALLVLDGRRLRALVVPRPGALAYGLAVGAFMALGTRPLYQLVADFSAPLATDVGALYARLGASRSVWRALHLTAIVAGEEIVWRGFVQSALERRYDARAGVLLAAVLYALAHVPIGSALLVALAFTCGLIWSGMRVATSSLLAPFIAHLLWDWAVVFIAPVAGATPR
jgi:membrane protease YdiL (CAAX protease family)